MLIFSKQQSHQQQKYLTRTHIQPAALPLFGSVSAKKRIKFLESCFVLSFFFIKHELCLQFVNLTY